MNTGAVRQTRLLYALLLLMAAFSLGTKINVLDVGAPYVTIDDQTMYEGGFLVWFGQAPPQRMYLESWISGLTSIGTYVGLHAGESSVPGLNVVADAFRDFRENPGPYVLNYRILMLIVDVLTALLVFALAREVLRGHSNREWIAVVSSGFYLLSFNTLWCLIVARPDTVTTFFSVLGILLYYKSNFGEKREVFLASGAILGLATGMKLHGAFFVVFICLDMWRLYGFWEAFRRVFVFGIIALIAFALAAGSVLFDPALYVKLRMLNARDDSSPWLEWGDQFITLFRGTGWLVVPLILGAFWWARRTRLWQENRKLGSLLFIALCWLLLFGSLRVLRAYWMLPALPLFYIAAAYAVSELKNQWVRISVFSVLAVVLASQLWTEMQRFQSVPYNQLRSWVQANVNPEETIYLLGYDALNVPLSTETIQQHRSAIEKGREKALNEGSPFIERHIKLWEERAQLALFDLLNYRSTGGYSYYGYHGYPPEVFEDIAPLASIEYFLVQDGFKVGEDEKVASLLADDFDKVAELVGPGGGGYGLSYDVYRRK